MIDLSPSLIASKSITALSLLMMDNSDFSVWQGPSQSERQTYEREDLAVGSPIGTYFSQNTSQPCLRLNHQVPPPTDCLPSPLTSGGVIAKHHTGPRVRHKSPCLSVFFWKHSHLPDRRFVTSTSTSAPALKAFITKPLCTSLCLVHAPGARQRMVDFTISHTSVHKVDCPGGHCSKWVCQRNKEGSLT